MGLLLFLVGLLSLASGATHLWRRKHVGASVSPFAIVEASVGIIVVLASAGGLSRWSGAPFVVVIALSVVIISVSDRVRRTLNARRRLLASEARRLESHVKGVD